MCKNYCLDCKCEEMGCEGCAYLEKETITIENLKEILYNELGPMIEKALDENYIPKIYVTSLLEYTQKLKREDSNINKSFLEGSIHVLKILLEPVEE